MGERMYDDVCIMSAELNAIIMTLEHLMNNQSLIANLQNIIVYSDSLPRANLELLSSAYQYKMDIDTFHCLSIIVSLASRGIRHYIQYVLSHSGITCNHQAGEIAKIL